jgi:hypothetical protein
VRNPPRRLHGGSHPYYADEELEKFQYIELPAGLLIENLPDVMGEVELEDFIIAVDHRNRRRC